MTIGAHERVEVLAREGRLAVLATSQAAAHLVLELIDELSIANAERRDRLHAVRALVVETIDRWDALYEAFPHAAFDELRRTEPRVRALVGLAAVTDDHPVQVMYAATSCVHGHEPLVWSDVRAQFVEVPGVVIAAAAVHTSRTEVVLSSCDPGCFDLFSLVDVVDCDPGCL